ncbi:acyl-CoA dehydrogenase [Actinophytocola oryzae]|uniref:Acyl-coenzyme A oxidase n=1 Tax=Actinophytocola oryzae TaxID=502181 RepID=A0A4R7VHL7_9PSEU|nr:acyl-CoA dehydrogenase [Actinophytocola oryzae]TDV48647.1 acyl-coenzyme A oxidase [Actinophytocola oryzae]
MDATTVGKLLADPIFDPPRDLLPHERNELTYRQLQFVNRSLAPSTALVLGDHRLLRDLLERTAMVSPSLFMAFFLHHCMAIGAVADYGGDVDGADLPDPDGMVGAILMTELGYGSSSARILTEAHYDRTTDEFVLRTPSPEATKFPSNVAVDGIARWGVVSARLVVDGVDHGVFLFRLPLRDNDKLCPGVSIRPIPAFPQVPLDYGSTSFTDVRVPRAGWLADGATVTSAGVFTDPLGGAGERTRRSVGVSRFAHGSNCLGLAAAARASLATAAPYVHRRFANDRDGDRRPLAAHRNVRTLLTRAMADTFAATAVARRVGELTLRVPAAHGGTRGLSDGEFRTCALGKVAVSRLAERGITGAQRCCGVAGFIAPNRLWEFHEFAVTFHNAGGDNQMYLLNAAPAMVDGVEYEPPVAEVGLPSAPESCVALLRRREHDLHAELVAARDAAVAGGHDTFTIWDELADLTQEFVEAHLARTTAEHLRADAVAEDDPAARRMLLLLCELFAMTEVRSQAGWYLATEVVTASWLTSLDVITRTIDDQLMSEMDTLVEMLDVPTEILRSPIVEERFADDLVPPPVNA